MSVIDAVGLLIGAGALSAVLGYLAYVYRHPDRFRWLELPKDDRGRASAPPDEAAPHGKAA